MTLLKPKLQFSLRDLFFVLTALPVCVGIVAAINFTACNLATSWLGVDWMVSTRHFLIDNAGIPVDFVTGYVSFAMLDVPAWICLFFAAFSLGLIRTEWACRSGVALLLSIALYDLLSDFTSGLHRFANLRLVSLFGVLVVGIGFFTAPMFRGQRPSTSQKRSSMVSTVLAAVALIAVLAVSAYGWWVIELER